MGCNTDEYYKEALGECFPCGNICDNREKTGSTLDTCKRLCIDYLQRNKIEDSTLDYLQRNKIENSTSGPVFQETDNVILGISLTVVALVILVVFIVCLFKRKNTHTITITQEEEGDKLNPDPKDCHNTAIKQRY